MNQKRASQMDKIADTVDTPVDTPTEQEEEAATVGERLEMLRDRIAALHPFPARADDVAELIDILLSVMPKRALAAEDKKA
jgi:hypothetical protein